MNMISVLRLGHRYKRDERLSTHVALASRALGASEIIFSGEHDSLLEERIKKVIKNWGGSFCVSYKKNYKRVIEEYRKKKYIIVHLTVYGLPIQKEVKKIRKCKKLLIIVGSQKVPGEVYRLSDFNISVTSQPHSEVAALAIFMHEFYRGSELNKKFANARVRIKPCKCGKDVKKK